MGRYKKSKKDNCNSPELWTEEQYEEYMKDLYGMEYVAGFTNNGVPYGILKDKENENVKLIISDISTRSDDELPF